MYFRAGIAPIDHTAGIPKGPSRRRRCAGDTRCRCLEEVELVGRVLVDTAANEGQEGEEKTASDEDEGDEGEDGS